MLEQYTQVTPRVKLSGPTNFAPIIDEAIKIVARNMEVDPLPRPPRPVAPAPRACAHVAHLCLCISVHGPVLSVRLCPPPTHLDNRVTATVMGKGVQRGGVGVGVGGLRGRVISW